MIFHAPGRAMLFPALTLVPCVGRLRAFDMPHNSRPNLRCMPMRSLLRIHHGSPFVIRLEDVDPNVDYFRADTAEFIVWENPSDGAEIFKKVSWLNELVIPANNVIQFYLTAEETASFPAGSAYWEAWIIFDGGENRRLAGSGVFSIHPTRNPS